MTPLQCRPLVQKGVHRMDEEPQGKVDLVSVLYTVCGIPGIVVFLVITFFFARSCGFSA